MRPFGWLIAALLLTRCSPYFFDPYQRPGTWNPASANDANLRVMVVNPQDLVEGTGQATATGATAAPPVARLIAGKRYPLPTISAAPLGASAEPPQGSPNPSATP